MKKLIALLLCLVMVMSVFAGCNNTDIDDPTDGTGSNTTPSDTSGDDTLVSPYPKDLAAAEEITYEPIYYLSFEDDTNLTAVEQVAHVDADEDGLCDNCTLDGATYEICTASATILHTNGVKGQCLYLDGSYGVKLENLVPTDDDSYTISFWLNASRLSDYMPSLQIGRNIGMDGYGETVSWINVTQVNFFGTGANFPTIWNRNSSFDLDGDGVLNYDDTVGVVDGVWPWINKLDDTVYGKNEWIMITIVATGEEYQYLNTDTGLYEPRIGCYMYINGVEVMNGTADGITPLAAISDYHGLSPEIISGDGLEGYLGINYWDYTMKGFFDELYIYDEALTAGQVATLWADGDATVESVVPEGVPDDPTAPVDANAIDTIGTPDYTLGWWGDHSNGYELADGASVTMQLNNYSNAVNVYNNYVVVLANLATTNDLTPSASNYPGYAEWGVVRADCFGWGYTEAAFETSWNSNWDDTANEWAAWQAGMTDADVTLVVSRNGNIVTIASTMVMADGTTYTSTSTVTTAMADGDPCYVIITAEGAYLEILSVE